MANPADPRLAEIAPGADYWSVRLVREHREDLEVRRGKSQPFHCRRSEGAFVLVVDGEGCGYAATPDTSIKGLLAAGERARHWARAVAPNHLIPPAAIPRLTDEGNYQNEPPEPPEKGRMEDRLALLHQASDALAVDSRIVDWRAQLSYSTSEIELYSSAGGRLRQVFHYMFPALVAFANAGTQTQRRSGGGYGNGLQGGLERLDALEFSPARARLLAEQAIELLSAPECPDGIMDLLLAPSQMVLQIHETIGHPLELDRILGDERNYAGGSFVTLDMFGNYRYGSELLNVTFDPTRPEQLASYAFDDDGSCAQKTDIIRQGVLQRPLGSASSQVRADIKGVANARACSWNRPPIDRMANLNLEPGLSSLARMVSETEKGVLMDTNRSWSIDDRREKFQFGCELGYRIDNGTLKGLVRNPSYRGSTRDFWYRLSAVGDESTLEVRGTPNCGKGEPNQIIHVGHASPACLFRDIDVFSAAR